MQAEPAAVAESVLGFPTKRLRSKVTSTQSLDAGHDIDHTLDTDLSAGVADFLDSYKDIHQHADLLNCSALAPAKRLAQVLQHLRDISWRITMSASHSERLGGICSAMLPVIQAVVTLAGSLDVQVWLDKGVSRATILGAAMLGIEASTIYCVLVGVLGAPVTLIVEETLAAIVQCLRQCMKQVVVPSLSHGEERVKRPGRLPSQQPPGEQPKGAFPAPIPQEDVEVCSLVANLMHGLHEFLCRHSLADEHLHRLIHMAVGIFFLPEPDFKICSAAEEMLVTIFGRRGGLRGSLLQEFLAKVPKLASGKSARKFQLPVADDSPDMGLSTWTHLLLRLVQSTCLPIHEPLGANVDFATLLSRRQAAQKILAQLTSGLVQRLLLTRVRDDELRAIFEDITEELLIVAFKPPWPGALALVRTLVQQLIGLLQPDRKNAIDIPAREFALKVLSKILARMWHNHVETSKAYIKLPSWDEPPEKVSKDERLLQHIALRISLEDERVLPWTAAARAVEAWDAEIFVSKSDNTSGLRHFTDDIVFQYLTLAHIEDERAASARCPPAVGSQVDMAAAVFSAGHPVHACSFLACDWAESSARLQQLRMMDSSEKDPAPAAPADAPAGKKKSSSKPKAGPDERRTAIERFLMVAWTSQAPFGGEGTSWRTGGGRRHVLPFTLYKVYRQLRNTDLEGLRRAAFDCVLMQANSAHASLRKTAMRALSDIIDTDASVLGAKPLEETIDMRLRDESSWVRQVSLELLGRTLDNNLDGAELDFRGEPGEQGAAPALLGQATPPDTVASAMLLRFHQTVRGRINDTSVLVRRQASRILSAFVLSHPSHPDVVGVALDLLRRSTDSELLRSHVLGTFELLWFMDEEPTPQAAHQLARVVEASREMSAGSVDILEELLRRFKKNINTRKRSKGFGFAIRRWTTLLLNEFVQLKSSPGVAACSDGKKKKQQNGRRAEEPAGAKGGDGPGGDESNLMMRSLLSTLEAFSVVQPREMLIHLRPLTVYLALDDKAPEDEQWVALKVCRILSAVLPCAADQRGLIDHRQVQQDLQVLITNQPSTGVHEAVRCLCLVVKYVTGDLSQVLTHLNTAVPALSHLCRLAESMVGTLERIQQMYMARQVWILSSVFETLCVDEYIQWPDDDGGAPGGAPKQRRPLPRSSLRFEFVGGSVASTVADLLVRLYALGEPQLQAVVVTCLDFFLRGQRSFVKDRRISKIIGDSLAADDMHLCLKALAMLASLLSHFGAEADLETRAVAKDFGGGGAASAVESAQPLAVYSDLILSHITLAGSIGPATAPTKGGGAECRGGDTLRIRVEALAVVRNLHQQGLVNPMAALPKVFALSFAGEPAVTEPASLMLREMLELRPTLLLNRIDEAFREAFLAVLAGANPSHLGEALDSLQFAALGEVYAESFRKQKSTRDSFIRKTLREVFRLHAGRFHERFLELVAGLPKAVQDKACRPRDSSRRKANTARADNAEASDEWSPEEMAATFRSLPLLQHYQLLYAQFIASALCALPLVYENEPLLVVCECNYHISLHAGSLFASYDQQGDAEHPQRDDNPVTAADTFTEAVSILACFVLKGTMKKTYGLSAEQCAQFNPKDPRQEKLKCGYSVGARSALLGGLLGAPGEEAPGTVHVRFPTHEWCRLAAHLAARYSQPEEIVSYIRKLTDSDPWDSNHSRHVAAVDRLEGRPAKRGRPPEASRKRSAATTPPNARAAHAGPGRPKRTDKRRRHVVAISDEEGANGGATQEDPAEEEEDEDDEDYDDAANN